LPTCRDNCNLFVSFDVLVQQIYCTKVIQPSALIRC
jgi:hypothetical protein